MQFAKRRRARVLATASGRDAAALLKQLGADAVIDARRSDATEKLKAVAPKGIDAALVLASNKELEGCLSLVRPGGRVAYPNGVEPEPRRRPKIRLAAYDAAVGTGEFTRLERAVVELSCLYRLQRFIRSRKPPRRTRGWREDTS